VGRNQSSIYLAISDHCYLPILAYAQDGSGMVFSSVWRTAARARAAAAAVQLTGYHAWLSIEWGGVER